MVSRIDAIPRQYTDAEALAAAQAGLPLEHNGVTYGTEASSTPVSDDDETTLTDNSVYITSLVTLPTAANGYVVTYLEWKNGLTVDGNVRAGLMEVDADPPTVDAARVLCITPETAQSGVSSVQKVRVVPDLILPAGVSVMPFLQLNGGTSPTYRFLARTVQNAVKAVGAFPFWLPFADESTTWTTSTVELYLKVYYKPVTFQSQE